MESISRRDFFKKSVIGAAAATVAVASTNVAMKPAYAASSPSTSANTPPTRGPFVKYLDDMNYEVAPEYKRFKNSNLGWMRIYSKDQPPIKFTVEDMSVSEGNTKHIPDTGKELPKVLAEMLGIKDRNCTMSEAGAIHFLALDGTTTVLDRADQAGYRQLEVAMSKGGWAVEIDWAGRTAPGSSPGSSIAVYPFDRYTMEQADEPIFVRGMFNGDNYQARVRQAKGQVYQFESPDEAAKCVKKAARFFGATLAGVAKYDERWTYADWATIIYEKMKRADGRDHYDRMNVPKFAETKEVEVYGHKVMDADWEKYAGFTPTHVLVFAVEMDYEILATSPSPLENAGVGMGYTKMAETAYKLAVFLRDLGYNAASSGNGDGLSVPLAMMAGLGEMGRNSNLITMEYGPRVRLAKVYTDLEMTPDKPVSFGVKEFCSLCKKCAESCPSQAISYIDKPRVSKPEDCGQSENPYKETWGLQAERCLCGKAYTSGCTNCVAVCSWNKLKSWNHDVARLALKLPLIKDAARKFDEWFGYNGPVDNAERLNGYTTRMAEDFWNNPDPLQ